MSPHPHHLGDRHPRQMHNKPNISTIKNNTSTTFLWSKRTVSTIRSLDAKDGEYINGVALLFTARKELFSHHYIIVPLWLYLPTILFNELFVKINRSPQNWYKKQYKTTIFHLPYTQLPKKSASSVLTTTRSAGLIFSNTIKSQIQQNNINMKLLIATAYLLSSSNLLLRNGRSPAPSMALAAESGVRGIVVVS